MHILQQLRAQNLFILEEPSNENLHRYRKCVPCVLIHRLLFFLPVYGGSLSFKLRNRMTVRIEEHTGSLAGLDVILEVMRRLATSLKRIAAESHSLKFG